MAADSLRILELHVYRGWSLYHRGEKCLHLTAEDLATMRQPEYTPAPPATLAEPATEPTMEPATEPAAPPPPPIVWRQYIYTASGGAAWAYYYHNEVSGSTTWEEPKVPYHVADAVPSVEPWTPKSWISGTHHGPEADCDRRPSVQPW